MESFFFPFVLKTPVLSFLSFFVTFAALPVVVVLTFDLIVSLLSRSTMAARRRSGEEGMEERKDGRPRARRREGGGALRPTPFNETVIYASPRNHKT